MIVPKEVLTRILEFLPVEDFLKCHVLSQEIYTYLSKTFNLYRIWGLFFKSYFIDSEDSKKLFFQDYERKKNFPWNYWKDKFINHFFLSKTLKVVDTKTREDGVLGEVWCLNISNNGKYVYTCGSEPTAKIWSLEDGKLKNSIFLDCFGHPVSSGVISPDSNYVAMRTEREVLYFKIEGECFEKDFESNQSSLFYDSKYKPFIRAKDVPWRKEVCPGFYDGNCCLLHFKDFTDNCNVCNYQLLEIYDSNARSIGQIRIHSTENRKKLKKIHGKERPLYDSSYMDFERSEKEKKFYFVFAGWSDEIFGMILSGKVSEDLYTRDFFFWLSLDFGYKRETFNYNLDELDSISVKGWNILDARVRDLTIYANTREAKCDENGIIIGVGSRLWIQVISMKSKQVMKLIDTGFDCVSLPSFIIKPEIFDEFYMTGTEDGHLVIYNRTYFSKILEIKIHKDLINCVRVFLDKDKQILYFVTGSDDESVKISSCKFL